jgi:alkylated DNA repair dioxygenase AlkB
MIPGLILLDRYLSAEAEADLLRHIDGEIWLTDLKRRVQHYGYRYDYRSRSIDASMHLGPLPAWAQPLADRLHTDGLMPAVPDQLIVNEYHPGQGIAPHVDCVPCFTRTIVSISLGSPCVMTFEKLRAGDRLDVLLEPGSLLIMRDEARFQWKHGIAARKSDIYDGRTIARARRISLTFRNIIPAATPVPRSWVPHEAY